MQAILVAVAGFVVSGLIWRLLASIGFGIGTAYFINKIIDDYLVRSINLMGTALPKDVAAFLNLIGADHALSVMIGGVSFVASYKALKIIFFRQS